MCQKLSDTPFLVLIYSDMDFNELKRLLEEDRSVRRYDNSREVTSETLEMLVNLTRYCASGRNAQPLRYRLVWKREECDAIFPALAWAGYYKDWDGPAPSEQPRAYLIQCLDTELGNDCLCDDGLQLQAITLGATTLGLRGCIIKAFNAAKVAEALGIDGRYKPRYVLALGYPAEKTRLVDMKGDGDFKYYRDEDDTQCVPKRGLDELII